MSEARIIQWLEERRDNCVLIAATKNGEDRSGWMDDAHYFQQAINEVSEARELLRVSEHDENSAMSQVEWDRRVTEFLERNKESQ